MDFLIVGLLSIFGFSFLYKKEQEKAGKQEGKKNDTVYKLPVFSPPNILTPPIRYLPKLSIIYNDTNVTDDKDFKKIDDRYTLTGIDRNKFIGRGGI